MGNRLITLCVTLVVVATLLALLQYQQLDRQFVLQMTEQGMCRRAGSVPTLWEPCQQTMRMVPGRP